MGRPEEPEGLSGPWTWLPQQWQLGTWPWGSHQLNIPPLRRDLDLRQWKFCGETVLLLVRTENNVCLVEIYRNVITHPQEHRIWHQEVCSNWPFPSLTFPVKGLCWELLGSLGLLRDEPSTSLQDPQQTFLCSRLQHFDIAWPRCASGTWTCISIT